MHDEKLINFRHEHEGNTYATPNEKAFSPLPKYYKNAYIYILLYACWS